jgi:hypothetical protein
MSKLLAYQEARQKIEEAKKIVRDTAKEVFTELSTPIFAAHPELDSFSWNQYSPYFNDGDECVFSANTSQEEIGVNGCEACDDDDANDSYSIANSDHDWDTVDGKYTRIDLPEERWHPMFKAQRAAAELLSNFDSDTLEEMFGNHAEVTVNRDGTVEVEHYSHD